MSIRTKWFEVKEPFYVTKRYGTKYLVLGIFKATKSSVQAKFIITLLSLILFSGCTPSALQMANNEANAASKAIPQKINIDVPFDAREAKLALEKGNHKISGVLYHRLDITGRDETGWLASPLIKNQPFRNAFISLFPESVAVVAFEKMFSEQQSIMKKWYTNPPSIFNRQPQTKQFILPKGVLDYSMEVKTDDFGRYTFNNLKPGRYYLYTSGWQTGTYNKDVYAGSSHYSDGTGLYGVQGTVHHTRTVPVNYKTYLVYQKIVDVTSGSVDIDSRMQVDYNEMSIKYDK